MLETRTLGILPPRDVDELLDVANFLGLHRIESAPSAYELYGDDARDEPWRADDLAQWRRWCFLLVNRTGIGSGG